MTQKELWFQSFQTAPAVVSREFNPGSSGSLRLDQFASLFEFWRLIRCSIFYRTASATTSQGMVHGGVSFDASKNFVEPLSVSYLDPGFRGPIWSDQTLVVPPDRVNRLKWTPTSRSSASQTVQAGFEFWLALQSSAPADTLVGEIWIDYDIEFMSPFTVPATIPFATYPLYFSYDRQGLSTIVGGFTIALGAATPTLVDSIAFTDPVLNPTDDRVTLYGFPPFAPGFLTTGPQNYTTTALTYHQSDSVRLAPGIWKFDLVTAFDNFGPINPVFNPWAFDGLVGANAVYCSVSKIDISTNNQLHNGLWVLGVRITCLVTVVAPIGSPPGWLLPGSLSYSYRPRGVAIEPVAGLTGSVVTYSFMSPVSTS
jgi:hypothetical protein